MKVGPVNEDGRYAYAVVTVADMSKFHVWVRDLSTFSVHYEAEVLQFLMEQGFTANDTSPIRTNTADNCVYPNSFRKLKQ